MCLEPFVVVIDNGVDTDHPDLVSNIASGGYNYVGNDSDANPDGQSAFMSHGTHVAGIIAGMKNDIGMHGVAYNAKILALRVGSSGGSFSSINIESSIDHAISQGAKVINAS
jgi:subtilisin family serine protease